MSDQIRNEIAREKIRQMVREGKDPRSMFNHDNDIHDFQYNNSMEAVQDVIAQEKIRMMIARGETVGKTFSEHYDNDIRGYLQRSQSSSNSRGSSYSTSNSSNKAQADLNETCNKLILELQKQLVSRDLIHLNTSVETIVKSLSISGNPPWFITQMFDLKKQFESKMKSIDSEYERTIRYKKDEARHKAEIAESQKIKVNNSKVKPMTDEQYYRERDIREKQILKDEIKQTKINADKIFFFKCIFCVFIILVSLLVFTINNILGIAAIVIFLVFSHLIFLT
jgi:hypothetical protein